MHILMISLFYPPRQIGGAEKAASMLAESLVQTGNQVTVLSLHPQQDIAIEERNGVKIYRLPMDNLYFPSFGTGDRANAIARILWHVRDIWNWKAAKRVGRILDEEKPDVIHTHGITGFSVSVWKEAHRRQIRLVHTMHDYYLLCARSEYFRDGRACRKQCMTCRVMTTPAKKLSHKLSCIVSVSDFVLTLHRDTGYFDGVPGKVIYNIQSDIHIDTGRVSPSTEQAQDAFVFGFIGRITEAKGLKRLLEASRLMSQRNWQLKIAGDTLGDYAAQLMREYPDTRIEWLGRVPSQEFYGAVDVVVVPSIWHDPLPYVVVETFAAGKALICANSGGIPELARMGKQVGSYPADDTPELARLLDEAVLNPEQWRSGGFCDNRYRDAFSESAVNGKYSAVYSGLEEPDATGHSTSLTHSEGRSA